MRGNPNRGAGNYTHTPPQDEWSLDDSMNWRNTRDFSPTCRKCNGQKQVLYSLSAGHKRACQECQGTGADAIPWSELFRDSRLK